MCLMGCELFGDIVPDAFAVANALELFHNFTLVHDDIMDNAPLRRGMATVHEKYGASTALLAGDVMLVKAYDYLNSINTASIHQVIRLFNTTAREVCEGQQLDMDFEKLPAVAMGDYLRMIELKTSVSLAASLQCGAILGGAGKGNQQHLYEFGRNLGIAFQVQDDYLDAYGNPEKFGKQVGGDILANKKTFLMIHALETAPVEKRKLLEALMLGRDADKVGRVLDIFSSCGVDRWAVELKEKYTREAYRHLEEIAVMEIRKAPLRDLAAYLVQREY